ncbi:MAG: hypothetical protein PHR26_00245 [Candidatus ainarchaeum sp.]|nr:hypothetical protein [Candidatus ainarchaeum sp.]MDD3975645.1 hypothetical protein [Candidatus ainarchaeum sp.]
MNNKNGFIFSLTTLYYVIIFIIFAAVLTTTIYFSFSQDSQNNIDVVYSSKLLSKTPNIPVGDIDNDYWCLRYVFYSTEDNSLNYNNLNKFYCEEYYESKRFI